MKIMDSVNGMTEVKIDKSSEFVVKLDNQPETTMGITEFEEYLKDTIPEIKHKLRVTAKDLYIAYVYVKTPSDIYENIGRRCSPYFEGYTKREAVEKLLDWIHRCAEITFAVNVSEDDTPSTFNNNNGKENKKGKV